MKQNGSVCSLRVAFRFDGHYPGGRLFKFPSEIFSLNLGRYISVTETHSNSINSVHIYCLSTPQDNIMGKCQVCKVHQYFTKPI